MGEGGRMSCIVRGGTWGVGEENHLHVCVISIPLLSLPAHVTSSAASSTGTCSLRGYLAGVPILLLETG